MKNLSLDFVQRMTLINILNVSEGNRLKMRSVDRVLDAVRFSEEENGQLKVTDMGNGVTRFEPPSKDFGQMECQIEDADASVALAELNGFTHVRAGQAAIIDKLVEQFSAPSVPANKAPGPVPVPDNKQE